MKNIANANHIGTNGNTAFVPRSKYNTSHEHKTTFKHGKLVPIYCSQVLPGSTINLNVNSFVRLATPLTATLDNLVCDLMFYFVPNRIIWTQFEQFMGITEDGTWNVPTNVIAPGFRANVSGVKYGCDDVMQYLGCWPANINIPTNRDTSASALPTILPLRAYMQIWNDHFRDPNFEKVIPYDKSSNTLEIKNTDSSATFYNSIQKGFGLAPVCKNRDIFTSSFLSPQKGDPVRIPVNLEASSGGWLFQSNDSGTISRQDVISDGYTADSSLILSDSLEFQDNTPRLAGIPTDSLGTINALREAFAVQKFLENDMQNRYVDYLKAHYGVSNGDDVLQRAQYVGGKRFRINMNQVVQSTSATVGSGSTATTTPAGYIAGYSSTFNRTNLVSFTAREHGWLMGVCVTRIEKHTYSQMINPQFFMNTRYDIYSPEFAMFPYQPVMTRTIYAGAPEYRVFGYNEAWWQYKMKPNRLSSYFATQVSETLDFWHYGDYYNSAPTLSSDFLHEESYQLDRTLAIDSDTAHPYLADFFFDETSILPIPSWAEPGLPMHA